mgnify:CR=1 FL=1
MKGGDDRGEELVRRFRRGDEAAFNEIFRSYRSLVWGVLHHLMPNDPELEDVVQQAFVEVFRSLDTFEGRSKLSSWVARVALHVGYHHLRRKKSRPHDYDAERSEVVAPVEIGDYTWVASDVTILKGVRIGSHCIVGTRSLVTHDVPDHSLAFGSPATVRGKVGDRSKAR